MAALSSADRLRAFNALVTYLNANAGQLHELARADVQAAVNYTDTWIDSNVLSFTSGLPEPFKSGSNANQKLLLFLVVACARVSIATLRALFGRVD